MILFSFFVDAPTVYCSRSFDKPLLLVVFETTRVPVFEALFDMFINDI